MPIRPKLGDSISRLSVIARRIRLKAGMKAVSGSSLAIPLTISYPERIQKLIRRGRQYVTEDDLALPYRALPPANGCAIHMLAYLLGDCDAYCRPEVCLLGLYSAALDVTAARGLSPRCAGKAWAQFLSRMAAAGLLLAVASGFACLWSTPRL